MITTPNIEWSMTLLASLHTQALTGARTIRGLAPAALEEAAERAVHACVCEALHGRLAETPLRWVWRVARNEALRQYP